MSAILTESQTTGNMVQLQAANPRHFGAQGAQGTDTQGAADFGRVLMNALGSVNGLEQESASLAQAMITEPDSVEAHDVTIAMAKAEMAVSITKQVVDRAVQAYKEIISIR